MCFRPANVDVDETTDVKCIYCGATNPPGIPKCINCGKMLPVSAAPSSPDASGVPVAPGAPEAPKPPSPAK